MKKILATILTIITALGFTLSLAGCKNRDPYVYDAKEGSVNWHDFMLLVSQNCCDFVSLAYDIHNYESTKEYIKENVSVNGYFILECGEEITSFLPTEKRFEEYYVYTSVNTSEITQAFYIREYFFIGELDKHGFASAESIVYVRCYLFPIENYEGQELRYEFGGSTKYGRYINIYVDSIRVSCIDISDTINEEFMLDIPQQWWVDYLNNNFRWVQINEN